MAPYILLHGFAQTPASWDVVAKRLQAAGHRTYVPNLFAWLEEGCTLEEACERVAAIVRQVAEVEGAPVLVGYSMGGRLAAEMVTRQLRPTHHPAPVFPGHSEHADDAPLCQPERSSHVSSRHPARSAQREAGESPSAPLPLAALVLESAGLGPTDEAARVALAERNAAWADRLREEGVPAFMDWWEMLPLFATQRQLPEATLVAIRADRTAHPAEPLARSFEQWGAQHQTPEPETLAALAQAHAHAQGLAQADAHDQGHGLAHADTQGFPILYIAGECDQKYAAVAARAQAAGLPAALVPNAGHNTHLEQPDAFFELLP